MNKMNSLAIASLALLIAMTGCSSKGKESTVIAKVNRTTITVSDFKKQIQDLDPQVQPMVMSDPKARKEFLDQVIGYEVAIQEAKRLGLDKDAEFKKRQASLRDELERRIQEATKFELLANLVKKELENKVKEPTGQEIRDYYTRNIDKMRTADGKKVPLQQAEPVLKKRIFEERQRDAFVEYVKGLKDKAKISVDEKALDTIASADTDGMTDEPQEKAQDKPAGKDQPAK
jgi:hypothetical protein